MKHCLSKQLTQEYVLNVLTRHDATSMSASDDDVDNAVEVSRSRGERQRQRYLGPNCASFSRWWWSCVYMTSIGRHLLQCVMHSSAEFSLLCGTFPVESSRPMNPLYTRTTGADGEIIPLLLLQDEHLRLNDQLLACRHTSSGSSGDCWTLAFGQQQASRRDGTTAAGWRRVTTSSCWTCNLN